MPALNAPFRETVVCFVVLGLTICHCYASSRGLTAKGPNVPMPDPDNVLGCGPGGGSTCIIGYKGGNPAKRCPTGAFFETKRNKTEYELFDCVENVYETGCRGDMQEVQ